MDYEKKYKEALGWMQSLYNGLHGATKEEAEKYFPELKESEDEKIRKALIRVLNENVGNGIEKYGAKLEDALAWLEKQGEQKVLINDFKARNWYVSKVDGKIHDMTYNPADKVEPKFHEGDWVVYMGTTAKILDLQKHCYVGKDVNDKDFVASYCNECEMKKWTIQDAKDGDVLVDKNYMGESPFIFKETKPSNIKTDVPNPLTVLGYCGIGGAGFTKSSGWGDTANCTYYPATKEQRELLFQKMKEAGYEWNPDTKKLKKVEQKPTWSEDDDENLNRVIGVIERREMTSIVEQYKDILHTYIYWLKSLKQRFGGKCW